MPPKYAEDIAQLFKARPKLRFIKPEPKPAPRTFSSFSNSLSVIENLKLPPCSEPILPLNESKILRRLQRVQANEERIALQKENYKPKENLNATSNPYNTLFISNVPKSVSERRVRYELGVFGKIKDVKFVYDHEGNRKNYCFVEYEKESSFKNAMTQGTKLYFKDAENKRDVKAIVDCERGRTVNGWLPRRLGGGLGGLSRRFTQKTIVIEKMHIKRYKRTGYKCGIRYRGTLAEVSKRRDLKLGIERKSNRIQKHW